MGSDVSMQFLAYTSVIPCFIQGTNSQDALRLHIDRQIDAGTGLFASLYFGVRPGAAGPIMSIDTTFISPDNRQLFADTVGDPIRQQFRASKAEISTLRCFAAAVMVVVTLLKRDHE